MRSSKTIAYITCDRCGDQRTLDGLPEAWINISAVFTANIHAPETVHDLCEVCAIDLGRFINGDFVPPIPDKIEQPYESLTGDDFFDPYGTGKPPWECTIEHNGHDWTWDAKTADGKRAFTRYCKRCSLLWSSSVRIEGTR